MNPAIRAKTLVTDSDVKQKSLAATLNISEGQMSNYLNGKTEMPSQVIVGIAQYFHVTTDYLLGLTDHREPPFPVSDGERHLLEHFRTLSREQKELAAQNIELMYRQNQKGALI